MRFATAFITMFVSFEALVAIVNFVIDVDGLYAGRHQREREIASWLVEGRVVAGNRNYNLRTVQQMVAMKMERAPEVLVLGSSRAMEVSGRLLPRTPNVRNHAVPSGRLIDYLTFVGIYEQRGLKPGLVLVVADPWIFKAEEMMVDFRHGRAAAEYMATLLATRLADLGLPESKPWRQLFSLSVLLDSLRHVLPGEGECSHVHSRADDSTPCAARRADGSYKYPRSIDGRDPADLRSEIEATIGRRGRLHSFDGYHRLDSERVEVFGRFLAHLKDRGYPTAIMLSPYHPLTERAWQDSDWPLALKAMNVIKQEAARIGIPVVGDYSAHAAGCGEDEFYDPIHPRATCVTRILAGLPPPVHATAAH